MPRHAWIGLLLLAALPQGALAQGAAAPAAPLNDTQKQGERLFYQSCGVCHTKPQITSAQFAPVLSKESGSGQDDVIRGIITNGTPRMPGFKYQFEPEQISAIVAYLKTIPAPPPAPPAPAAR
jgi:mono/diheme cytochrome c family protein